MSGESTASVASAVTGRWFGSCEGEPVRGDPSVAPIGRRGASGAPPPVLALAAREGAAHREARAP